MAQQFVVRHGTVTDALGRERTGWIVYEDGRPSYPHPTKEAATTQARAIAQIRIVNGRVAPVTVID